MQRIIIGLGIGASVTFALFILMAFLIKTELKPPEKSDTPPIQISMDEPDDDLKVRDRRIPKKPPPPKNPPPPQRQKIVKAQKPTTNMNINMTQMEVGVTGGTYLGEVGSGMGDGDAIPMVVIEPRYPRKAAMEGIEGWVKFKFTVSTDGSPKDIQVVEAKPKRVFERDARKVIYKWKFKPKVVDGKPIEQPNMYYTMIFKLAE